MWEGTVCLIGRPKYVSSRPLPAWTCRSSDTCGASWRDDTVTQLLAKPSRKEITTARRHRHTSIIAAVTPEDVLLGVWYPLRFIFFFTKLNTNLYVHSLQTCVLTKRSLCLLHNCVRPQCVTRSPGESQQERKCSDVRFWTLSGYMSFLLSILRHHDDTSVSKDLWCCVTSVNQMIIWLIVTIQTYFFILFCYQRWNCMFVLYIYWGSQNIVVVFLSMQFGFGCKTMDIELLFSCF